MKYFNMGSRCWHIGSFCLGILLLICWIFYLYFIIFEPDYCDGTFVVIFILDTILCILVLCYSATKYESEQKREQEIEQEREAYLKKLNETKQKYYDDIARQEATYGKPDKRIKTYINDISQEIAIWGDKKLVYILGNMYSFSDIIDCSMSDSLRIKKGEETYRSTSEKMYPYSNDVRDERIITTTVYKSDDVVRHNVSVYITINDLSNPTIIINLGSNMEKAKEIISLMNIAKARAN